MRSRLVIPMCVALFIAALAAAPTLLHGQSATPASRHADMMKKMEAMRASDAAIESLVKKMNAARGPAREDAMVELLNALVQDRRVMHESMSNMSTMMDMMGGMRGEMMEHPPAPRHP